MGRTVLVAVALVLAVATPAFAHPGHDVPDFGSAVPVPSDSDYQITADGHLIYEGDMVISCEDVDPDFIASPELYEEQAEICAGAGFPPGETLLLLLGAGLLSRAIAPR